MGENTSTLAGRLQRPHDVEQVGIVSLFARRDTEPGEAIEEIMVRIQAGTPAFVREWGVGDHEVELLDRVPVFEFRIGKRVALDDRCRWGVVQDHVHASQDGGGRVLFLPVERHRGGSFVRDFQEQRSRAAGRIADRRF